MISLNEKGEALSCPDDNRSTKKVRIRKETVNLALEREEEMKHIADENMAEVSIM